MRKNDGSQLSVGMDSLEIQKHLEKSGWVAVGGNERYLDMKLSNERGDFEIRLPMPFFGPDRDRLVRRLIKTVEEAQPEEDDERSAKRDRKLNGEMETALYRYMTEGAMPSLGEGAHLFSLSGDEPDTFVMAFLRAVELMDEEDPFLPGIGPEDLAEHLLEDVFIEGFDMSAILCRALARFHRAETLRCIDRLLPRVDPKFAEVHVVGITNVLQKPGVIGPFEDIRTPYKEDLLSCALRSALHGGAQEARDIVAHLLDMGIPPDRDYVDLTSCRVLSPLSMLVTEAYGRLEGRALCRKVSESLGSLAKLLTDAGADPDRRGPLDISPRELARKLDVDHAFENAFGISPSGRRVDDRISCEPSL